MGRRKTMKFATPKTLTEMTRDELNWALGEAGAQGRSDRVDEIQNEIGERLARVADARYEES